MATAKVCNLGSGKKTLQKEFETLEKMHALTRAKPAKDLGEARNDLRNMGL